MTVVFLGSVVVVVAIVADYSGRARRWLHIYQLEHYDGVSSIGGIVDATFFIRRRFSFPFALLSRLTPYSPWTSVGRRRFYSFLLQSPPLWSPFVSGDGQRKRSSCLPRGLSVCSLPLSFQLLSSSSFFARSRSSRPAHFQR